MSAANDSETIDNPSAPFRARLRQHSENRLSPRTVRSTSAAPPRGPVGWGSRSLRSDAQQHHEPATPPPDSDAAPLALTCDNRRRTSPTRPSQRLTSSIPRSHKPTRNMPDRANQARENDSCREFVGASRCSRLCHSGALVALCSVGWDKPFRCRPTNLIRQEIDAFARNASSIFRPIAGGPAVEATLSHPTTMTAIAWSVPQSSDQQTTRCDVCAVSKPMRASRHFANRVHRRVHSDFTRCPTNEPWNAGGLPG